MHSTLRKALLLASILTMVSCSSTETKQEERLSAEDELGVAEAVAPGELIVPDNDVAGQMVIGSEPYSTSIVTDAEGNINRAVRVLVAKNNLLKTYYQRVGCSSDTCKQEFVTYTAIQYPKDEIMQTWAADIIGQYYQAATRQLDIKVNGEHFAENQDGEPELVNHGCHPYEGPLNDEGKAMFDFYQARVWVIGRDRIDEHGPEGRYGCVIYRCWQSPQVASYFVAYSTEEPHMTVHSIISFDRRDGHQLEVNEVLREEYMNEFNELLVDAARSRHYSLLHNTRAEFSVEPGEVDYSGLIQPNAIGLTEEGLAVSTGALPFDQLAFSTHIFIIPYEKVNHLLKDIYAR